MINEKYGIDTSWLKLDVPEEYMFNPMDWVFKDSDQAKIIERLCYIMSKPEYFYFTCKYILNVEPFPMQLVMLRELWNRKYPMLVASRGASKAISPNELIRVKNGWTKIKDLHIGDKVYSSNGSLCNVTSKTEIMKDLEFYKITLRDGRTIEACEDHLWKVWDKNRNRKNENFYSNLTTKQLFDTYFWKRIGKKSSGKEYRYAIPHASSLKDEDICKNLPLHPYVLGVLLGDGCTRGGMISITSKDEELVSKFNILLPEGYYARKIPSAKYQYNIVRLNSKIRGFKKICKEIGIDNLKSEDKFIPEQYKYISEEGRLELLKGLNDTDGTCSKKGCFLTSVSFTLIQDTADLARSLGISCKINGPYSSVFNKKKCKDYYNLSFYTDRDIFSLKRKLSNHVKSNQGKSKYYKSFIVNIEYIGKKDGMCITVDSKDRTYITKDYIVTHNSFTLALYALLRALLIPKRRIVVVGAAFRQSKVIFNYMETIWHNAPVLRDLCGSSSSVITRNVDSFSFSINGSNVICLPLGDGEKIRGQRANDVIADEFACLSAGSIVETIDGFVRIEDFDSHKILTGNRKCPIEYPEKFIKTPLTDVYEIKLRNGYVIRCSENHKVMTNKGWKKPLELTSNSYIEKSNKLAIFSSHNVFGLNERIAWLIGILISDGSITDKKRISITTTDVKLCSKLVNDFNFKFNICEEYVDKRGWKCKKAYKLYLDDEELRTRLYNLGLDYVTAHDKKIPYSILRSTKNVIYSFLSGLFEGNGSCFLWKDKHIENKIGLAYYSVSERLCRDVQFLSERLGYDGFINNRQSEISDNLQWFVRFNGKNAKNFASELNVDRFKNVIDNCFISKDPEYITWDKSRNKWKVQYNLCGKIIQKRFKEKSAAIDYVNILKEKDNYRQVLYVDKLETKENLYDYYLPITNSFYAEGHKQHNSIPRDIFERVVAGFTTVASNPVEKIKNRSKELITNKKSEKEDLWLDNQIVLSGTAYYDFNHYAEYWRKYRDWIYSMGDSRALEEIMGGKPELGFNWKDYTVLRVPVSKLPPGLMDDGIIARAKATVHSGTYDMEYGAIFSSDSQGFFKRSLIESCVVSKEEPIKLPSGEVFFEAKLFGDKDKRYIYGVDPASEVDHFSIVVLEVYEDHRRIVHCWTTDRKKHKEKVRKGIVTETDFYSYCARKIRDLMKVFPCEEVAMDAQGGGIAVMEALHDSDKIKGGELPIWPVIDPEKEQDTDDNPGLHILKMCQFAKYDWLAAANHGMRKDFEDKILLFPYFDSVSLGLSAELDAINGNLYDTLEDCVMDIEELKNELSMIILKSTPSGRERWDTPESKVGVAKVEKLRKDRYSALLMANMSARTETPKDPYSNYVVTGGFAEQMDPDEKNATGKDYYDGPQWWRQDIADIF